jgi:hypothetical protein
MKRVALGLGLLFSLLIVLPASAAGSLKEVYFYSPITTGGLTVKAQVNLTAAATDDMTIALSSNDPDHAAVPESIDIAAGKTYGVFYISTSRVDAATLVRITASVDGLSVHRDLTLKAPALSTVTGPASIVGGYTGTFTVKLTYAAGDDGVDVSLSTQSSLIEVPDFVSVAPGQITASFTVTTFAVETAGKAVITATGGGKSFTKSIAVIPFAVSSVTCKSSVVKGGTSTIGTVKLNAVTFEDLAVSLSVNVDGVTVPTTVVVLAGKQSATFTIDTTPVTVRTRVTITATRGTASKTGVFYVTV